MSPLCDEIWTEMCVIQTIMIKLLNLYTRQEGRWECYRVAERADMVRSH